MAGGRFSCIALLCLTAGVAVAEDLIPILAWSNRDTFSSVSADEVNIKTDIESLVQQSSFSHLGFVFVFRTAKLTFDDIAKYGSVYGDKNKTSALENIQSEVGNSVSSLWAGGEGTVASLLIDEIALKLDMSPKFISGMEDVAVIFGQPQLLVIDLPFGDSREEFAQQDAMVAEVLEAVHHLDASYAAFYTAMTTDGDIEPYTQLLGKRDAPSLMTSSEPCVTSYGARDSDGSYCALLCMTNATIFYWETKSDLKNGNVPCVAKITAFDENFVSGCYNSTLGSFPAIFATVQGKCSDDDEAEENMNAEIEFAFPRGSFQQSGQWMLEVGSWQMMIVAGPYNLSRYGEGKLVYPFSIPIGSSYACQTESTPTITGFSNPNRFVQISNLTDEEVVALGNDGGSPVVQFTGIHVQAYGYTYTEDGSPVFGTVCDCHGLFTLPSLMGVFSVIIVLIILYISVMFAFSMQTVDRFEDPRQPTITIENLH